MIHTENTAATRDERLRTILREAQYRFNTALMDDEERTFVRDRIRRLKHRLGL